MPGISGWPELNRIVCKLHLGVLEHRVARTWTQPSTLKLGDDFMFVWWNHPAPKAKVGNIKFTLNKRLFWPWSDPLVWVKRDATAKYPMLSWHTGCGRSESWWKEIKQWPAHCQWRSLDKTNWVLLNSKIYSINAGQGSMYVRYVDETNSNAGSAYAQVRIHDCSYWTFMLCYNLASKVNSCMNIQLMAQSVQNKRKV